jgi:hypothetical protein
MTAHNDIAPGERCMSIRHFARALAILSIALPRSAPARSLPRDTVAGAVCVDSKTGKLLWSRFPADADSVALIAGEGGAWLLTKKGPTLQRLDVATGNVTWSKPIKLWPDFRWSSWARPTGTVTRAGNRITIELSLSGWRRRPSGLALIDGETGKVIASHAGKLVRTKTSYALLNLRNHSVRCVDRKTGEERWTTKLRANEIRPLPDGDLLAVNGLWIARIGRNDGSIAWRCRIPRKNDDDRQLWWTEVEHVTDDVAIVKGEDLLVKNHREILASIDLTTGELQWSHRRFHFLTRVSIPHLRFTPGLYRETYSAADFPSHIVDGRIGFCDGSGLVEYRPMGQTGRRVWPPKDQTEKYEVWFYAPAGDGGWHIGAVETATGRGLLVRVGEDTKELWRIAPQNTTLTRPLFERNGVLWADQTSYKEKRASSRITGFGLIALDSRSGKELRRLPSLTSHLVDGWDACLERGVLPCGTGLSQGPANVRATRPTLVAVSLKKRERKWEFAAGRFHGSPELLATPHGHFVWRLGSSLAPIDLATGESAWQFDTGQSYRMGGPAFLGGRILLPSPPRDDNGKLLPQGVIRRRY